MAGAERSRGQFVFLHVCGGSAQNLRPKWTIQPSRPFLDGRDEAFLSASVTIVYFVFYALVVEFDPGHDLPSIIINSIQVYLFI